MNIHDKEVLEFNKILERLGGFCQYEPNKQHLLEDFFQSSEGFSKLKSQYPAYMEAVELGHRFLNTNVDLPVRETADLGPLLEDLSVSGLVLDLEHLLEILLFSRHFQRLAQFLSEMSGSFEGCDFSSLSLGRAYVCKEYGDLPDLSGLVRSLSRYIDDQGELKEDQIPGLKAARQRIYESQNDLRRSAGQLLHDHAAKVSGDFTTIRDGRMVLPLKSGFKGKVEGLIHQSSSSGSTLYVEPYELVEKNNALYQAEAELQQEIHRVMRQLSELCHQDLAALTEASQAFCSLDLLLARARFGRDIQALVCPEGPVVRLFQARHPLLGKKAVPISLEFPPDVSMMIISGPNTGGKTVSLKTLGLLVLMRQAGMEIPCSPDSCLPYYEQVLADIGDEQSISQNLSTFSGHLTRLKSILETANSQSLILLDELGSGTDPAEGAALALACAEYLLDKRAPSLITSHHGALKALAYSQKQVLNASMEFSSQENRPTYRIVAGIAGESHALDTAERLGLQASILQKARDYYRNNKDSFSDILQKLLAEEELLRRKIESWEDRHKKLDQEKTRLEAEDARLSAERQELKAERLREESLYLSEARSKVERTLRDLSRLETQYRQGLEKAENMERANLAALQAEKTPDLQEEAFTARYLLQELSQDHSRRRSNLEDTKQGFSSGIEYKTGDRVRLNSSGLEGILERKSRNGSWEMLVKGKRMSFKENAFTLLDTPVPQAKVSRSFSSSVPYLSVQSSIDVRGLRAAEACDAVIKQLDAALVQGLYFFSIIHGKGEGTLQQAILKLLKESGIVEKTEFARPEDGGSGKTLVYLRH